jgi:sortase A
MYDPDAKNNNPIEIHTETVEGASTYQVLHVEDTDQEEVQQELEQGLITDRYLRLEEAENTNPEDSRQLYYIYSRESADAQEEQRVAHMYVEEEQDPDTGAVRQIAYIYQGDAEAGSEDPSQEPVHFTLPEGFLEGTDDTAYLFSDSNAEGTKVAYHIGEAAQETASAYKRLQLVYADASGSGVREYISGKDIEFPLSGAQYGALSCGRIELKAPVYWNDTNEILRYGAGQYMGSMLPGFGQLIVLSGHNNTFFAPLQNIEKNDVIEFDTNYCAYKYRVTDVQVLNEKDLQKYITEHSDDEEEQLVMYTCYPFEATLGRKTERLTVFAERVSGYDVKWRNLDEQE